MSCSNLWIALTRKKHNLVQDESKLNRVLNLFDLTTLGIGSTLGIGVYVLAGSVAYDQAGPAAVISFLLAAVASTFAGLCYAEFAARVPKAGSAYVYSYVTVGEFIAFTIGWNLILEYVIGASAVARGLSSYIDSLTGNKMEPFWRDLIPMNLDFLADYPDILSFALVAILTLVLAAGVKESSILHSCFTVINLATIILVIVAGSLKADPANWAIKKEDIDPIYTNAGEGGFMPFGVAGIMAGAAKCFYAFVGFDCVATAGEEAKNAKRNVPLALILTLVICAVVYISISAVLTMMWPYYLQDPKAPFNHIFQEIGWIEIKWIVSVSAIFALFSSLLGALYSLPRICYAMGNDGVLFRFLGSVHPRTKTPINATIVSGLFSAVMAAVFSLHQLVDMLSIGTLLAYTLVAVCVLILRYESDASHFLNYKLSWKNLFRYRSSDKPSQLSSSLTKILVVAFCVLATVLGCLLTFFDFTKADIILASSAGAAMILAIIAIALQPTDSTIKISFKVPFVPLLPCLSVFCNIFLMLQLDLNTWIRFGVWLIVGYLIYFLYGIRKSSENKNNAKFTNGNVRR